MTNVVVLPGEYFFSKDVVNPTIVESPAAQTCTIIVLKGKDGFFVAHFDTPFGIDPIISEAIRRIGEIKDASLIGGDLNIGSQSSSKIFDRISQILKNQGVTYKHEHYSYQLPTVSLLAIVASVTAYGIFDDITPGAFNRWSVGIASLLFTYTGISAINSRLAHSYDAKISVNAEGLSTLITADQQNNSLSIFQRTTQSQKERFQKRFNRNPHLPPPNEEPAYYPTPHSISL